MISMKISKSYTEDAYETICKLAEDNNIFNVAVVDYKKGIKTDYKKPDTWPLKFFRVKNGKIECVLMVAVATAGYVGAGSIFTYNALRKLGFSPNDEIFHSSKEHVHLEFYK